MEPPPGFQKVTMKQLEMADKRFWLLLSEHTRSGIKVSAAGRPCDVHFQKCLDSTEFLTLLQHRAGGSGSTAGRDGEGQPPLKRLRPLGKGQVSNQRCEKGLHLPCYNNEDAADAHWSGPDLPSFFQISCTVRCGCELMRS